MVEVKFFFLLKSTI